MNRGVFLAFLLTATIAAKQKDRDWQVGKVVNTERLSAYAGQVGDSHTTYGTTTGSSTAVYQVAQEYTIEVANYIYVAHERLRWRWSEPADLTVNGPVKVAVDLKKKTLYLVGDDGKEHEADIVKKILKEK